MTSITSIPLKKLTLWKGNVRKTDRDTGIDELAASIKSTGLLQSLVVIPQGTKYAVAAGGRRLAALGILRDSGHITEDHEVPCQVLESEQALEASLAENAVRQSMHPADQFEAFSALSKQGLSNADIAARFGVSERTVEQRLKLARVAPAILKAYREGDTDLDCVMAFAVTDDAKAQLKLWKSLPAHLRDSDRHIRDALTEGEIDASHRRVRFVTLAAYEAAGGFTRRDLFTEGDEGIFILQPALLADLVAEKLEALRIEVAAEGWKWSEVREGFDWSERSAFRELSEEPQELPEDLQAESEALEAERDAIYERDDESDTDARRLDDIEQRLEEIENERTYVWPEGAKDIAGVVITIDRDGEADIIRGLVRPEDVWSETRAAKAAKPKEPFSRALVLSLKAQRSAAISAEIAQRTDIALAAIVHALVADVFYVGDGLASALCITSHPSMPDETCAHAFELLQQIRTAWDERLPGRSDALWDWCMAQEQSVLLDLLAFCTALSINAVTSEDSLFAKALGLDMRQHFTPTAANYFGRVSKAQVIEALIEAKGTTAPAWSKAKKSELAAIAERELAGTGWLPLPLRAA